MKKKNGKKAGVFDDRASIFAPQSISSNGFIWTPPPLDDDLGPSTGMGPLAIGSLDVNVNLLRNSSALLSSKLTQLVFLYELFFARTESTKSALKLFWELVAKWENENKLSGDERDVLDKAAGHDPQAIQKLITASPHVIKLPFIQEYLLDLLLKYRLEPKGTLEPIKKLWLQLLPTRAKNKIPYSDDDIAGMVNIELTWKKNRKDPTVHVAKALKISRQKVRQVCPVKSGPGRLKA